jgi:hypothetical protein
VGLNELTKKKIIPALAELLERNKDFFNSFNQKTIWVATNNPNKKKN